MDERMTLEELRSHEEAVKARSTELAKEYENRDFPSDVEEEFDRLKVELAETRKRIEEREARYAYIESLSTDEKKTETEARFTGAHFQTRRASKVPEDPTDIAGYRSLSNNLDDLNEAYGEGARRIVDSAYIPTGDAAKSKERMEYLLEECDDREKSVARRFIHTSNRTYLRAFMKAAIRGNTVGLDQDELRALGLGSQGGNYPIPVVLDPTVILTTNGVVNPLRTIGRVIPITGNHYEGVISAGITASYSAENTATSDNSPTLTQPVWDVEKAQAWIPFSVEEDEDWPALQSEMARELADAKDTLEATQFLTGLGHGSNAPQGLLVGATAVVNSVNSTGTMDVRDIYAIEEALAPRWRPRASFLANKAYLNKVRQLDTAGGANLWVQLGDGTPSRLLDYPTYELSTMSSSTATGSSVFTIGDFSQFYIVERIGMNAELVPTVFGTAMTPTGQRGIYAHWRNTAGVTTQLAFKTLKRQ
jgi:HK97 family phage major capsid protein